MEINAVEDRRQSSEESAIPGNFAKIANISLGLQKFRNLSEIVNFRLTPRFSLNTIPSEILHFRYSQEIL